MKIEGNNRGWFFTSESVTEGHPDKICDIISDSILDAILKQDKNARVACETFVSNGLLVIGGEISTNAQIDKIKIIKRALKNIGYTDAKYGFDYKNCTVLDVINTQSPDIARGVDTGGAGDQGLMIGFACKETKELMPLPIMLAHKLALKLSEVRKKNILKYLGPDGKTQITVEYRDWKPYRVDTIVLSTQHTEEVLDKSKKNITKKAKEEIFNKVIKPVVGKYIDTKTKVYINPTGVFLIGGPQADTGLTGRKIIVDTYGGFAAHGGGAFSGKDATKVDRSACYMARHIAKNIVASGVADKCTVQLAYAIGIAEPVSIMIDTHHSGKVSGKILESVVRKIFPLTPKGIIDYLGLRNPIFTKTAAYGHFGRSKFPWEATNKSKEIKKLLHI